MNIKKLVVKNFKRVAEVQIIPDRSLVLICGLNGAGKSSTVDAFYTALKGASVSPTKAIRKGADEAIIEVDLGDIIVRREFHKTEGGDELTRLTVQTVKGAKYDSPQKMLDKLFSKLSFDPLAFAKMGDEGEVGKKRQFAELQKFVPGVDFVELAGIRKGLFDRRTEVNRLAKDAAAAAHLIAVKEELPLEPVDITALVTQMTHAGQNNARLEQRKAGRETAKADLARHLETAAATEDKVKEFSDRRQLERIERVRQLQEQIERENEACAKAIQDYVTAASAERAEAVAKADELQLKLDGAEALPEPISLTDIQAQIEVGRKINEQIALRNARDTHLATAKKYEGEAETLTAAIDKSDKDKAQAIKAAVMPVPELSFGDGEILYKDVPFSQASDAERLRVSVAIAMAQNSELKVLRIKEGSLLDPAGLQILDDMAAEHGYQVWVEKVLQSADEPHAWLIEDGSVKHGPAEVTA